MRLVEWTTIIARSFVVSWYFLEQGFCGHGSIPALHNLVFCSGSRETIRSGSGQPRCYSVHRVGSKTVKSTCAWAIKVRSRVTPWVSLQNWVNWRPDLPTQRLYFMFSPGRNRTHCENLRAFDASVPSNTLECHSAAANAFFACFVVSPPTSGITKISTPSRSRTQSRCTTGTTTTLSPASAYRVRDKLDNFYYSTDTPASVVSYTIINMLRWFFALPFVMLPFSCCGGRFSVVVLV